jgi:hypothetical protein
MNIEEVTFRAMLWDASNLLRTVVRPQLALHFHPVGPGQIPFTDRTSATAADQRERAIFRMK